MPKNKRHYDRRQRFGRLIGKTARMLKVFSQIKKAAKVDLPVLVVGETGTGKELVAREIHDRSPRRNGPFVAVNMGVLPVELIGSELFGHVKGAFTGASEARPGRFEEAEEGTLFLDEIVTMDERIQVALLRVLENGNFRRVGGRRDLSADVRVVAASNVDPATAVRRSQFRPDLLHRLQVIRIQLPPLRQRKTDLKILAQYFLEQFRGEFDSDVEGIASETWKCLKEYSWPGNVRELKNVIAQATVMAEKGDILPDHLPARISAVARREEPAFPVSPDTQQVSADRSAGRESLPPGSASYPFHSSDQEGVFFPLGLSLKEVEKAYVLKTLALCGNNKTQAAKILGVSRKTLYDRLVRWGMIE